MFSNVIVAYKPLAFGDISHSENRLILLIIRLSLYELSIHKVPNIVFVSLMLHIKKANEYIAMCFFLHLSLQIPGHKVKHAFYSERAEIGKPDQVLYSTKTISG